MFTKPAFQVFENKNNTKAGDIKMRVFKVLGICITQYNQAFGKIIVKGGFSLPVLILFLFKKKRTNEIQN